MSSNVVQVWVLMKDWKEVEGTLMGFDSMLNMVLSEVVEQEQTPEGMRVTRLE